MNSKNPKGMMSKALTCGVVGVLAVAIAPLLLTRLYELEQISAEAIGIAICIELIGMAVGSVVGAQVLGRGRTSGRIILATLILAAANYATPMGGDSWVFVARLVAGLSGGALIWVTITTIVRSTTPERWSGIYLSGHTAVQFLIATLIAAIIIPETGATGGYVLLAIISLLLIPVALTIPDIRPYTPTTQVTESAYPAATWPALLSIFAMNAMLMSVLSYAEIEFHHRGFSQEETLTLVPIILGAQIIGGLIAAYIAPRLPKMLFTIAITGVLAGSLLYLNDAALTTTGLFLGVAVFGFCWLLIGPFHLGFLLQVSRSLQAAELLAAAQLGGLAIGPLVGAMLLSENGYPPLNYHLALLGLSLVLLIFAYAIRSRTDMPAGMATTG